MNALYRDDNLNILRNRISDASVDLIYLDPPFNSGRNYSCSPGRSAGHNADAQIEAFEDTWHWNDKAEDAFDQVGRSGNTDAFDLLRAMRGFLGDNDMMAYLSRMAIRLIELHRVLNPTGSLYLHCDPTASHYLKLLLDGVFGADQYRSELIRKSTSGHSDARRFGTTHDVIFFFSKSEKYVWNDQYTPYDVAYINQYYRYEDKDGRKFMSDNLSAAGLSGGGYDYEWNGVRRVWRCPETTMRRLENEGRIFYTKNGIPRRKRFLDEALGMPAQDVITDVEALRSWHQERLGYPTQKPVGLLERVISASSIEGDVVLDPFCGCGTAVHAAQKLGRQWIGIDVTHLAINLIERRLLDAFPRLDFEVVGRPESS